MGNFIELARKGYNLVKNRKYGGYANIEEYAEAVLNSGDARDNYDFARNIPGADIQKHAEAVLNSGDARYNYLFAKNVVEADIPKHAEVVLNSKDVGYNYFFAKNIYGANIKEHAEVVLKYGSAEFNYLFAKNVRRANIKEHSEVAIRKKSSYRKKFERRFGKNFDVDPPKWKVIGDVCRNGPLDWSIYLIDREEVRKPSNGRYFEIENLKRQRAIIDAYNPMHGEMVAPDELILSAF